MQHNRNSRLRLSIATVLVAVSTVVSLAPAWAQREQTPPVKLELRESFRVPAADEQSQAIVRAAIAFRESLSPEQRRAVSFPFDDNAQRSRWSNLPEGIVQRAGIRIGDLDKQQHAALDVLLAELMSPAGVRNIDLQLAAEDTLESVPGRIVFSSEIYTVSFLGEPSLTAPWMFQFGGHHLAINTTIFGPWVSFAPMLTGGQPTHITYQGKPLFITEKETSAARTLLGSLSKEQKAVAVRGSRAINLLLGPGEDGRVLAPEGIRADELSAEQKRLLLDLIVARLEFFNDDDFHTKMSLVEAELNQTTFGWWGPEEPLGAAYFRVTGPSLVLEYAPQGGRDPTDHVHSMFREPGNDYGASWIAKEP